MATKQGSAPDRPIDEEGSTDSESDLRLTSYRGEMVPEAEFLRRTLAESSSEDSENLIGLPENPYVPRGRGKPS